MRLVIRCAAALTLVASLPLLATVPSRTEATPAAPAPPPAASPTDLPPPAASIAPAPVRTGRPTRQPLRQTVEQAGPIEGVEETPLFARVSGEVQKWHADIGDRVKAGQVLAELAVPELEDELGQKDAAVALAKAELAQARRALQTAEAALVKAGEAVRYARAGKSRAEAGYARWEAEYGRVRRLASTGAVDAATRDQTYDQFKAAESARDESQTGIRLAEAARDESSARRDQAQSDVGVAEAKLRVAEAARKRAAAALRHARVRAPFDGVVSRRNVATGHLVQPAPASGGGTPLFVVVRTDTVRLFLDVPEAEAGRVRRGTPARVRVPALGEEEFEGRVTRTSWVLDARTRTLRTQVELPNPDGLLRPGMSASATLTFERPDVLTLPASAVLHGEDGPLVLRVEDGRVVRTPVRLGARQGGVVEVLGMRTNPSRGGPAAWEAFTDSEEVVLSGVTRLSDGQCLRTQPEGGRVARASR